MEPAELLIHHTPSVAERRNKDFALKQLCAAEAAFAAAAVGINGNSRSFKSNRNGFVARRGNYRLVNSADNRDIKGLCFVAYRVAGNLCRIDGIIHNVVAETLFTHAHFLNWLGNQVLHRERAAEHIRRVLARIFFNNLSCDKALFALPRFVVGKNVNYLNIRAILFDLVKFILQNYI